MSYLCADRRADVEQVKPHLAYELVLLHVVGEGEWHDLGVVHGREAGPADRLPVLEEGDLRVNNNKKNEGEQ